MPGLNPNGLASGFRQGFGMMADYQAQQQQMDLQRQQEERAQQQFASQQQMRELKMDQLRDERNRALTTQGLQNLSVGQGLSEDQMRAMNELGVEPRKLVTGEYLEAAEKLQGAMAGQQTEQLANTQDALTFEGGRGLAASPDQQQASPQAQQRTAEALNDPDIIEAANTFLEPRVRRGVGEEVQLPDGGRGKVLNKRIQSLVPMEGGTVGMDLEVTAQNADGEPVTYTAPATERRSSDPDDPVQGVPIDELMSHAAGLTQEAKAFQMDPQARENARQALYRMDPDMAPERKIVDLGAAGKAIQTSGAGRFDVQPIPGTAEGRDPTTAGQKYRELVGMGTDPEKARRLAYGELDRGAGDSGASGPDDWRIPVMTDDGERMKAFSDADLRNHYKTQYNILSENEIQSLRTSAMLAEDEQTRQKYQRMAREAVQRKAQAPNYNEFIQQVRNNGLDLRTEEARRAEQQPTPAEQEAEAQQSTPQGARQQGGGNLMEQARRNPTAYARVLRQANPDASEEAIRDRVRERFPAQNEQPDSGGMIPEAGAAEPGRTPDPVAEIVSRVEGESSWLAGDRPDPGELQQRAEQVLNEWREYAPQFPDNEARQRVLRELRRIANGDADSTGLRSLMQGGQ